MTPQSIHDAINRNSTKVEYLERIAKVLEVPISYFFDEYEVAIDQSSSKGRRHCLGCADKSEIISLQRDKIGYLEKILDDKGIEYKKDQKSKAA